MGNKIARESGELLSCKAEDISATAVLAFNDEFRQVIVSGVNQEIFAERVT